jgi:REP element-mobilizing transposase RayT
MANTYCRLHFHLVFATKNRLRTIEPEIEPRLHAYIVGILNNLDGAAEAINGTEDHIHLLFHTPPKLALSQVVTTIKSNSSKLVHDTWPRLTDFGWQRGYALITESESSEEPVKSYIANQKEHHRRRTFEEEYRALLDRHGISYDEKYVFD